MSSNGKAQRNVTKTSPDDANPDWTPDGSKITYDVSGTQVFAANSDGTGMARLIPGGYEASWSSTGKVAYTATSSRPTRRSSSRTRDGSGAHNVTNAPGYDDNSAVWSPDGTKIAFVRFFGAAGEIFVMNADGSGQTDLTNDPANDGRSDLVAGRLEDRVHDEPRADGGQRDLRDERRREQSGRPHEQPRERVGSRLAARRPARRPRAPGPDRLCKVPNLLGQKLAAARTKVRKAGCVSGTVKYARSKRPRGRVVRQTPRKGLRLCFGVRVNVVVSRGLR